MRLTLALLKKKMPNGNIWTGKHRLGHNIYPGNIERMVKRLQLEENNMLLLRHPYLTLEQEKSGERGLAPKVQEEKMNQKLIDAASRTRPSVRLEDSFKRLMVGEKWDCY